MDTDSLKEKLQDAKESLQEAASEAVEGAQEVATNVTADVKEVAKEVVEDAKNDIETLSEKLDEATAAEPAKPATPAAEPATPAGPTKKLPTDRNIIKFIVFSICTIGIYALVQLTKISSEVNTVCKPHDKKSTMSFIIAWLLAFITCGIVPLVWYHKICDRIGMELMRRQLPYSLSSGTFWGWCILGSCIVIGPYVFLHKFLKAMNTLNADYNEKG